MDASGWQDAEQQRERQEERCHTGDEGSHEQTQREGQQHLGDDPPHDDHDERDKQDVQVDTVGAVGLVPILLGLRGIGEPLIEMLGFNRFVLAE